MIRKASFDAAIGNIARWGDTDVFPKPLDNHVVGQRADDFRSLLKDIDQNFDDSLGVRPPATVKAAVPNGYAGFRWATQLDPTWNAYLLALVINIAEQIEAARVSAEWVFSHRVDPRFPDNRLFREDAYAEFVRRSRTLAEDASHVVTTDIADFYGRVNHHPLENALLALPKQGGAAKRVIKVLGALSSGRSYGLPVGGPAARLLAELYSTVQIGHSSVPVSDSFDSQTTTACLQVTKTRRTATLRNSPLCSAMRVSPCSARRPA